MGAMDDRVQGLRAIPLFQNLDEGDLSEIAGLQIERKFPKGAVIFEEGTLGDYMYLIQEGQVKVTKMSEDGREKILEILGPGDFFGEMSVLDREPRSASIKTTRACILLALSRQDFLGSVACSLNAWKDVPDASCSVWHVKTFPLTPTESPHPRSPISSWLTWSGPAARRSPASSRSSRTRAG